MKTRIRKIKELVKDEEAVSPVIGVILMIAITVVIAAVVASFAYGIIGGVSKAPNSALVIEDAIINKDNITIIHHGGDTVTEAFTPTGGPPGGWDNILVKFNGEDVTWSATNVTFGGDTDEHFETGEQIDVNITSATGSALQSGNTISVVFKPTGDILQRVKVT